MPSIGVTPEYTRNPKNQVFSKDVPFVGDYPRLTFPIPFVSLPFINVNYESSVMHFGILSELVAGDTNEDWRNISLYSDRFLYFRILDDYPDITLNFFVGKNRIAEFFCPFWHRLLFFDNILKFRAHVDDRFMIYSISKDDSRPDFNGCGWRHSNVFEPKADLKGCSIFIKYYGAEETDRNFYPRAVGGYQCLFGDSSGLFSGSKSKPQKIGLNADAYKLEKCNNDQEPAEKQRIPIIRRLVEAILGFLIGLSLCFCGWLSLYYKRRILGATLVGGGWLLGALALGLFWLTRFPSLGGGRCERAPASIAKMANAANSTTTVAHFCLLSIP
jgi:hypothetical protein